MLGAVGFTCLAVIAGGFAATSAAYYKHVPQKDKRLFVGAYSILAVTALVWLAAFLVPAEAVPELVFMSDILLIVATVLMLGIFVDLLKPLLLVLVALVGAGLLTLRAYTVPSQAYIEDGLIHFNLSQGEALAIGLLFLAAWLPATLKVLSKAFAIPKLAQYQGMVSFLFIATILMTSFFIAARRPFIIIVSFVSMLLFFAILTIINATLVRKAVHKKSEGGRHG